MIFAWIASVIYGVNAISAKLITKHVATNPWFFNFFWSLVVMLAILPIALVHGVGVPVAWGSILILGVLSFLSGVFYVLALYQLDASILGAMYNLRSAFTAVLGAAFLNEILTGNQYILIGIIVIAGILLNFDEHLKFRAFFTKKSMLGLFAVFLAALFGFAIKNSIALNGFWETSLWMTVITQIFLLGTIPLFYKEILKTPIKSYGWIVLVGFFSALADLASNKAYESNVSISSAIIALPFSMILAYLFSTFAPTLLKKHTHKVYMIRFAATTVMIIAALQLS